MTKEDKAKIARENGAKSKGPVTSAGKERSARNALKNGERAKKFACFIPPHEAVLCNEDRDQYETLVEDHIAIYKPLNQAAYAVIGDMATARWQIERLHRCITTHWNLALLSANNKPNGNLAPELHDLKAMADASAELLAGNGLVPKMNREIARLQQTLARSERRLKFIHANFPDFAPARHKRTEEKEEETVANEGLNEAEPEKDENDLPPIFTSENVPEVIEAYKSEFPGRRIVIVPHENVSYDDKMPKAPRKAK